MRSIPNQHNSLPSPGLLLRQSVRWNHRRLQTMLQNTPNIRIPPRLHLLRQISYGSLNIRLGFRILMRGPRPPETHIAGRERGLAPDVVFGDLDPAGVARCVAEEAVVTEGHDRLAEWIGHRAVCWDALEVFRFDEAT